MSPNSRLLRISAIAAVMIVTGCKTSLLEPRAHHDDLTEGRQFVATRANTRMTYFGAAAGKLAYCAEPMPDAIDEKTLRLFLDGSHKGNVSIKAKNYTVGAGSEDALKGELVRTLAMKELAGRNPSVLVARELMYRLCELGLNTDVGSPAGKAVLATYESIALAVTQMAMADRIAAEADKARADAALGPAAAQENRRLAAAEARVLAALVKDIRGCTDEAVDHGKLDPALKHPDLAGVAGVLDGVKTCGELKRWLEVLPAGTLELLEQKITNPTNSTNP